MTLNRAFLILLASAALTHAETVFVAPFDVPPAFRCDRIPLDVPRIQALSKDLTTIAAAIKGEDPRDQRLAAQCLAMATVLDPLNREARRVLEDRSKSNFEAYGNEEHKAKALKNCYDLVEWLQSPTAGSDGEKLSSCLKDVIYRAGAGERRYELLLRGGEEVGAWNNWVADVSAFTKPDVVEQPPVVVEQPPVPVGPKVYELKQAKGEVVVPMWCPGANDWANGQQWVLKPDKFAMQASYDPQRRDESLRLRVGSSDDVAYQMESFSNRIVQGLARHHKELPGGLRISIGSQAFDAGVSSQKDQSISAAAYVLANAAVAGVEPTGIIICKLSSDGKVQLPSDFWPKLQCFGKGSGQRMVVSSASLPYFESIMAMGNSDFFLQYEVVAADTVEELVDAASKPPQSTLASATERFAEIQRVAAGQNTGSFIANQHVRQRLREVVEAYPKHISGTLLLRQSNGKRPIYITREVLANEMLAAIQPMGSISSIGWDEVVEWTFRRVPAGEMGKTCQTKLDAIERYVDRNDKELFKKATDLVDLARELEKAFERRGEPHERAGWITQASRDAAQGYEQLYRELQQVVGKR
ncbi:MAG TPA: hypothetical protein VFY13_10655 [Luteolibacter sp.]|nr:hypothetical protein [Luteolibacter sp.]